ncbi:Nidogen-2 [Aix galericulata]|nr:Nidogen-2 [Aix galericulata]
MRAVPGPGLLAGLSVLFLAGIVQPLPRTGLLPHGPARGDLRLKAGDDESSPAVALPRALRLYGRAARRLYVSAPLPSSPAAFPALCPSSRPSFHPSCRPSVPAASLSLPTLLSSFPPLFHSSLSSFLPPLPSHPPSIPSFPPSLHPSASPFPLSIPLFPLLSSSIHPSPPSFHLSLSSFPPSFHPSLPSLPSSIPPLPLLFHPSLPLPIPPPLLSPHDPSPPPRPDPTRAPSPSIPTPPPPPPRRLPPGSPGPPRNKKPFSSAAVPPPAAGAAPEEMPELFCFPLAQRGHAASGTPDPVPCPGGTPSRREGTGEGAPAAPRHLAPLSPQVGTNGVISTQDFPGEPQYVDDDFPTDFPVVAPFLADLDTSGSRGDVHYRHDTSPAVLKQAAGYVRAGFPLTAGSFVPDGVFVATWEDVGAYQELVPGARPSEKVRHEPSPLLGTRKWVLGAVGLELRVLPKPMLRRRAGCAGPGSATPPSPNLFLVLWGSRVGAAFPRLSPKITASTAGKGAGDLATGQEVTGTPRHQQPSPIVPKLRPRGGRLGIAAAGRGKKARFGRERSAFFPPI